jgi:hypothetical protein
VAVEVEVLLDLPHQLMYREVVELVDQVMF